MSAGVATQTMSAETSVLHRRTHAQQCIGANARHAGVSKIRCKHTCEAITIAPVWPHFRMAGATERNSWLQC